MSHEAISNIDKKIEELILNKTPYNFVQLKHKVEEILKSEDVFILDNKLETKAFDLYFNIVVSRRNASEKKEEEVSVQTDLKVKKYALIETICQELEFESQDEVIQKVQELERKSIEQLNDMIEK